MSVADRDAFAPSTDTNGNNKNHWAFLRSLQPLLNHPALPQSYYTQDLAPPNLNFEPMHPHNRLDRGSGRIEHCPASQVALHHPLPPRSSEEEALRSQARREALRATIADRIRQSLDLDEVLNTTVKEVRELLQVDRTLICRLDSAWNDEIVVESVREPERSLLNLQVQREGFHQSSIPLYQEGRIQASSDIYTSQLSPSHTEVLEQLQVRARLVVPILQGNTLWGLLIAHHCDSPRRWDVDEVYLLQQLSVQLAIAVQQAELHQQLQAELAERKQIELALRKSEVQMREQALQLQHTLAELKRTQAQLIHNEKMSSLGQLVAGIAHEINNSINFVHGNLVYTQEYSQEILEILKRYQEHCHQPSPALQQAFADTNLDFIAEDFPKVVDSMRAGTTRIREVVKSLRSFSCLDEANLKTVNIHTGIDSALMILRPQLNAQSEYSEIQVVKQYGDLPLVQCYSGSLNQVFMNLLSNAINAIVEQNHQNQSDRATRLNTIQITTELLNSNRVIIQIADTGVGISPDIQQHIFDPFFTTRPVGKGIGMGLAVSYQIIVEKHRGQLLCKSVPGKGTEFVIEIPIAQSTSNN